MPAGIVVLVLGVMALGGAMGAAAAARRFGPQRLSAGLGDGRMMSFVSAGRALHAPVGGPVPARTQAASVSFISPRTGFVLGTAPCAHAPCSVVLRTQDRGATWVGLPAPRESISMPEGRGLWGLRFADSRDGYAYGDGLWQTENGGGQWRRVTGSSAPGRSIYDLEAVDDRELVAIAAPCSAGGCLARRVLTTRSLHGARWSVVARARVAVGGDMIAVHGGVVWVLLAGRVYVSEDGGASFNSETEPCDPRKAPGLAAASITNDGPHTYMLCIGEPGAGSAEKRVYVTSGPHAPWSPAGRLGTGGTGGTIAAGSDHAIIVASSSGASWLYRSADNAQRWRVAVAKDDGGLGWADLGFTTANDAVVVHGPAGSAGVGNGTRGQVLLSGDGGRTWHATHL